MIAFPNCKINLGLHVLKKRNDGYHDIETVFYPVKWRDALEIVKAEKFELKQTGKSINVNAENNLCANAWKLMQDKFNIGDVQIHLHKVIPTGAGLGGGSSDAAETIKLLNKLFELKLSDNELEELASEIGSDCAFFIKSNPVLARGRGNIITEIEIDLSSYKILIIKPEVSVSTSEAYGKVTPKASDSLTEIIKLKPEFWKDKLINDFEIPVFKIYPEIAEIKNKLYEIGAVYASMSGSGSAVYGLFEMDFEIRMEVFRNYNLISYLVTSTN